MPKYYTSSFWFIPLDIQFGVRDETTAIGQKSGESFELVTHLVATYDKSARIQVKKNEKLC